LRDPVKLKIKRLRPDAVLPAYQTPLAAGMDLCACGAPVTIPPMGHAVIPTGIAIELPKGYGAFLFARSGLAIRSGIKPRNGVGVVDADYRGEIRVGLENLSGIAFRVEPGDRIAQMVILRVEEAEIVECEDLSDTERGEGGFGSTGKK